jgi:two-component sensor histidine kinase/tetratricopeptide (TPR) repeat protein
MPGIPGCALKACFVRPGFFTRETQKKVCNIFISLARFKSACMYKTVVLVCFMTALLLPGRAQVIPLPSMEDIRADMKKAHTDTGNADLMLNLALSYVYRPGENKSDLDSAMLWVKQAQTINRAVQDQRIEAKTYFVYSNILREGGDTTAAHKYIEQSLAIYRAIDAPSDMAEAWMEESCYYSFDKEGTKKMRENFLRAVPLFERAGNKLREADALKNIGDFDKVLDEDRRLAMKEEKDALAIYLSIGYPKLFGVYIILVDLCHEEGDYPNMVRYCELAVKNAEMTGEASLQMARIYNETGLAYRSLHNFEKSITFHKKAIGIAKKYDNPARLINLVRNVCYSLLQLGRTEEAIQQIKELEKIIDIHKEHLSDEQQAAFLSTRVMVYGSTKHYDKSISDAREFIRLLKKHPSTDRVYFFSVALAMYFIQSHQWKEAEACADSLLRNAHVSNTKEGLATCYELKSKADSAIGDLRGALTNYQLYKRTTDSVFNEASSFQLAQLQVESETEKKDNDIKALQQQQEIQKARLERSRTTNTIVVIGVIVLTLLLVLLYNRYRIKQRLNRQLEQKQQAINEKNTALEQLVSEKDTLITEKDWLVKEIHHRVKNNLETVISLLNAQAEFLENPMALSAIQESRARMEAIAIIHQKLYQTENNTLIHVHTYAYELVDNLQDSFACARDIYFQLNIADIALDISQSVPLGLILNEAITNAIKYAYPKGERGTVSISLQPTNAGRIELRIADKGNGLPPGLDWKNSPSLGLQLINLLAQQLNGELCFISHNGLEIVLIFKPTPYTLSAISEGGRDNISGSEDIYRDGDIAAGGL